MDHHSDCKNIEKKQRDRQGDRGMNHVTWMQRGLLKIRW